MNDDRCRLLSSFDGYQSFCATTAIYPGKGSFLGLMYVAGKLNGEAGEVAENVFKALRDDSIVESFEVREYNYAFVSDAVSVNLGIISPERREKIKKELGDTLWYVARVAAELGYPLSEIAAANAVKLGDRKERGVLQGSGDER